MQELGYGHKRERAFWLDVLRVLLCTGVVVSHCVPGCVVIGTACVDGFFVLSGFLLAGGFERMRQKGGMNVSSFYQGKLIRLMPTLLAGLLLGFLFILAKRFISSAPLPLYSPWTGSDFRLPVFLRYYNAPSWYMACECAFLLLAPFLYYVYGKGKGWVHVLLAAAFAFAAALYFKTGSPFAGDLYYEPHARLWHFIAGLYARCMLANIRLDSCKKWATFILFALSLVILSLAAVKQGYAFAYNTGMVLVFMVSIPAAANFPAPSSLHWGTAFAYLAALTYPVYLYHFPVQGIVYWVFGELLQVHLPHVVLILTASCATLLLSALSLRYLDGFFARRKN